MDFRAGEEADSLLSVESLLNLGLCFKDELYHGARMG